VGVTCLETDQRNMSAVSRGMFLDWFIAEMAKDGTLLLGFAYREITDIFTGPLFTSCLLHRL